MPARSITSDTEFKVTKMAKFLGAKSQIMRELSEPLLREADWARFLLEQMNMPPNTRVACLALLNITLSISLKCSRMSVVESKRFKRQP